jgi:hypothetical protein
MIRLALLATLLFLAVAGGIGSAAFQAFGWAGAGTAALAAAVLLPLAAKAFGGRLLERLFKAPFRAKGAPLRGATTRVHAVRPAASPLPAGPAAEAAEPRGWYTVELTITPAPAPGAFKTWAPLELLLVAEDADPEDPADDTEWGDVHKARAWGEDGWVDAEDLRLAGEQRLRLLVGVRAGAPRVLRLRYYFEIFGRVDLARAPLGPPWPPGHSHLL